MVEIIQETVLAIQNSEIVCDASGRQYHINLAPGDLAEYVILVGDPQRAVKASRLLSNIRLEQRNREFFTFTGDYKGLEVSIMSTGIGTGNIEIAMVECYQITENPAFIRVGTCGILQKHINLGDLIISNGAVRLEDTSTFFVHEGYPAVANYEVMLALIAACERESFSYTIGLTATASGFYGAQGRNIPGIPLRYPQLQEEMAQMNVANFEMESSTLFILANLMGVRASTICVGVANRPNGTFIDPEGKRIGERNCLVAGLDALVVLAKMDKNKIARGKQHWYPESLTQDL